MDGFTLVEMAIVLVLIGLLTGGILVGKDMIEAAYVRAQIKQISAYDTAVMSFRLKYNGLPGDLADPASYGMVDPLGSPNGILEDDLLTGLARGENSVFFQHLSSAQLIDGSFTAGPVNVTCNVSTCGKYFPQAKIGNGNYVTVFSDANANYYEILGIVSVVNGGYLTVTNNITPGQGVRIDEKLDDALPLSGKIQVITDDGAGHIKTAPTLGPANCVFTGGTQYNTTTQSLAATPLCRLRIRFN